MSSTKVELNLTVVRKNFGDDDWTKILPNLRKALKSDEEVLVSSPKVKVVAEGGKGEPITTAAFVIAVASAPAVVRLAKTLNTWVESLGKRKVKITIQTEDRKITADARGFSKGDVEKLVKSVSEALPKRR